MKKYIKIILLAIITLSYSNIYAQKCKYAYDKKDPFTGEISKGVSSPIAGGWWLLGMTKLGDNYNIEISLRVQGDMNTDIMKGDPIMFKLENDKVLTVYANEQYSPNSNVTVVVDKPSIYSVYQARYTISKDDLKLLADSAVTYIKMNISDGVYQREIKKKHAKKILRNAYCISQ